jgi:hypothetical protein
MSFSEIKDKLFGPNAGDADKNKKMLMLMPVLLIGLIFAVSRALKQPASSQAAFQSVSTSADANFVKINWPLPEVYPADLRDPMQPGSSIVGEDKSGNVIIKGIIYSEDKPAVLIDDKIMRQGDAVAGATIVKINKDSVEFKMKDKVWTQQVQQ